MSSNVANDYDHHCRDDGNIFLSTAHKFFVYFLLATNLCRYMSEKSYCNLFVCAWVWIVAWHGKKLYLHDDATAHTFTAAVSNREKNVHQCVCCESENLLNFVIIFACLIFSYFAWLQIFFLTYVNITININLSKWERAKKN